MSKKEAYLIVLKDLVDCPMFTGIYDAKNGNKDFMWGVSTVMENIAINVSEDIYEKFSDLFCDNIIKSQERK